MAPLQESALGAEDPTSDIATTKRLRSLRNVLLACAVLVQLICIAEPVLFVFTFPLGLIMLIAGSICHASASHRWWHALVTFVPGFLLQSGFVAGAWTIAEYIGNGFRRGRQVRERGKLVLAGIEPAAPWWPEQERLDVPVTLREGLAAQWRDNGLTEHASVMAFARLTSDLLELGAPSRLVASAQRDGQDELRHTELCFALAHAIDGQTRGPSPFPTLNRKHESDRVRRLQRLAVDSLFDGALHEGVSARIIAKLARVCEVPQIQRVLVEIARDEGRHAAHAWDVVEWCLNEGGSEVADALRSAAGAIPAKMDATQDALARGGAWERYGIHGSMLADEAYTATLDHLRSNLAAILRERKTLCRLSA